MKNAEFHIAIQGVPKYYAVFLVSNFPEHEQSMISNGNLMYWNPGRNMMFRIDGYGMGVMISHDYLRFVSYMTAAEMQKENDDATNAISRF